jgi:hypothetical protein
MKGETVVKSIKVFLAGLLLSGLLGSESLGAAASGTTRTDSGGGVTVKVTFLDPKASGDLRFQVVLDTHSVTLDSYDLKRITVLRDDTGNSYPPTSIENRGSGHHRQATVVFAKIVNSTKRVELLIKDVAGVKERIFRWDIE